MREAGGNPADARRAIPHGARESRWTAPDGHPIRRLDMASPEGGARGSLLFLSGRGDGYEKYLEALGHWHRQGWRVTAIDWRGQAGSGRLGADEVTGHIEDFTQWTGDLAAFWCDWSRGHPGPRVLVGHSMGGHLALRAVAEGLVDPAAVVLTAPMLGIGRLPPALLHAAARLMVRMGDPRRPAWKWSEKPGEPPAARAHLLTHDPNRYEDELWWRRERPELVMGPGSWGWVERAYASMRGLFARGVLEGVRVPVLVVATSNDKLVSWPAIVSAVRRLPAGEIAEFGAESHHEILREADPVRLRAFAAIDDFLARTIAR
ncbi:alpha/beta fold hydrolase [Tsuneonella amylolytica]|uniref:alpha/beta fold hydrolase n=1 Tax=Tsuneonella amylolytica TaxID=2338327 RepID=UPI001F47DD3B|nr:alpha/beta hydrolase [Tsuneonella amylolytica]